MKQAKILTISEFRVKLLTLVDDLPEDGIVITRRGEPVARFVPVAASSSDLIGSLADVLHIKGDIMSTGEHWDAES